MPPVRLALFGHPQWHSRAAVCVLRPGWAVGQCSDIAAALHQRAPAHLQAKRTRAYAMYQETAALIEVLKHFKPHFFLSVNEEKGPRIPRGK